MESTRWGRARAQPKQQPGRGRKQSSSRQWASVSRPGLYVEADEKASEPDDLLFEGEEQEYFLKLLMRKASPERPKAGQRVENRDNSKDEAASAKGKEKKRNKKKEKKALRKSRVAKEASEQEREEGAAGRTSSLEKQTVLDLLNNPEAKAEDWLLAIERRRSK